MVGTRNGTKNNAKGDKKGKHHAAKGPKTNKKSPSKASSDLEVIVDSNEVIELRNKLKKMQAENLHLQAAQGKKRKKKSTTSMKRDGDLFRKVFRCAKHDLFLRGAKFITNDEDAVLATKKVYKVLKLGETGLVPKDQKDAFVEGFKYVVKNASNEKRSYCTQELRKASMTYMDNHNGELPSAEDILKCAYRTCEDSDLMVWYTDVLLPCVTTQDYFGPNVRHYKSISSCKHPQDSDKQLIRFDTEAYLCVLYENSAERYKSQHKYAKENTHLDKKTIKWRSLDKEHKEKNQPTLFKGKYSNQDGGQQEFGGWKEDGLTRFNLIKEQIKAQRVLLGEEAVAKLEDETLKAVRKKHGIKCNSSELEALMKRRAKRSGLEEEVKPPTKVNTLELSDDESDGLEEYSDDEDEEEDEEEEAKQKSRRSRKA